MLGIVEIDGTKYVERPQFFSSVLSVTTANGRYSPRLVLPGNALFWLKTLTRDVIAGGSSVQRRFGFRFGNTDGGIWYISGGVGAASDYIIDTLVFGDGQFPFVLVPHVIFSPSASILMEIVDLSGTVPYDIHFGFGGSYLLPV